MQINSFNDIDIAGKRLCEVEVEIEKINGEVTTLCNEIKERFRLQIEKLSSEKAYIEQQITAFCEENKSEFAEKRSKEFIFVKIGYKISKSMSLPRLKDKVENLIKKMKK